MFFQMMLKVFLQNWILEIANGYFVEHTIHHLRAMNVFSITLIRLLIPIISMIKFCLWGDFNTEISEQRTESFRYMHELCNLVKEKTCFKNVQNPSCILEANQKKLLTEITNNVTLQNLRMSWKMFLQKKISIVVLSLMNNFWKF